MKDGKVKKDFMFRFGSGRGTLIISQHSPRFLIPETEKILG
jgi:hypothetical protein